MTERDWVCAAAAVAGDGVGAGSGIIGGSCRAVGIRIDGDHLDTGDHVHCSKRHPGTSEAASR